MLVDFSYTRSSLFYLLLLVAWEGFPDEANEDGGLSSYPVKVQQLLIKNLNYHGLMNYCSAVFWVILIDLWNSLISDQ